MRSLGKESAKYFVCGDGVLEVGQDDRPYTLPGEILADRVREHH